MRLSRQVALSASSRRLPSCPFLLHKCGYQLSTKMAIINLSSSLLLLCLTVLQHVTAAPARVVRDSLDPTVTIGYPQATIIGVRPQLLGPNTEEFPGIPFALPPTGERRLKPPVPITEPMGTVLAQANGNVCPQMVFSNDFEAFVPTAVLGVLTELPLLQQASTQNEDCLQLNVCALIHGFHVFKLHCWSPMNIALALSSQRTSFLNHVSIFSLPTILTLMSGSQAEGL
jgi:hypothetical protein